MTLWPECRPEPVGPPRVRGHGVGVLALPEMVKGELSLGSPTITRGPGQALGKVIQITSRLGQSPPDQSDREGADLRILLGVECQHLENRSRILRGRGTCMAKGQMRWGLGRHCRGAEGCEVGVGGDEPGW